MFQCMTPRIPLIMKVTWILTKPSITWNPKHWALHSILRKPLEVFWRSRQLFCPRIRTKWSIAERNWHSIHQPSTDPTHDPSFSSTECTANDCHSPPTTFSGSTLLYRSSRDDLWMNDSPLSLSRNKSCKRLAANHWGYICIQSARFWLIWKWKRCSTDRYPMPCTVFRSISNH